MSTLGIAHHQRQTFPPADDIAACKARAARFASKDAAYRAALGLSPGEPLPSRIGSAHSSGGALRDMLASGGRRRSSAPVVR